MGEERSGKTLMFALLPGHVAMQRGKRSDLDSKELFAFQDDSNGSLSIRAASGLPGGGKALTSAQLFERMSTFNKWLSASTKVRQLLRDHGFLVSPELEHYDLYVDEMRELSDSFQGSKEAWMIFLSLDQDLRLFQFDKMLSWSAKSYQIHPITVMQAISACRALQPANSTNARVDPAAAPPPVRPRSGAAALPAWGNDKSRLLLSAIPAKLRTGVCLAFYIDGRCDRKGCQFASKHSCLFCGSTTHGSAQCTV
jgi:hypothetical protein